MVSIRSARAVYKSTRDDQVHNLDAEGEQEHEARAAPERERRVQQVPERAPRRKVPDNAMTFSRDSLASQKCF